MKVRRQNRSELTCFITRFFLGPISSSNHRRQQPLFELESNGPIQGQVINTAVVESFNDVTSVLSSYRHNKTCRYWWKVKSTGDILFAKVDNDTLTDDNRLCALLSAAKSPIRAVEIKAQEIISTEWVDPMYPPFMAPLEQKRCRGEIKHVSFDF